MPQIASTPVAVLIALATTVPVRWRRSHPALAALGSTAAALIPSHGFVYVGYVVALIVFYSAAAYIPDLRGRARGRRRGRRAHRLDAWRN